MGTSINLPTPRGGDWTDVKHDINSVLNDAPGADVPRLVAGLVAAAGGLSFPSTRGGTGIGLGGGRGGGGGSGGSGGGRAGSGQGRSAAVGRAVSGLGGFGAAVRDGGLAAGLAALGLAELRGLAAAEVIARIAEHLAGNADGLQQELLNATLRDAILDAVALEGDRSFENLEASLQSFLANEGVDGLVERFLTRYVADRVWTLIENHVDLRTESINESAAMSSAVERSCQLQVQSLMDDLRAEGRFDRVDWFGAAGQKLADGIVATLEYRLRNPEQPEAP